MSMAPKKKGRKHTLPIVVVQRHIQCMRIQFIKTNIDFTNAMEYILFDGGAMHCIHPAGTRLFHSLSSVISIAG